LEFVGGEDYRSLVDAVAHEPAIRLAAFVAVLTLLAAAEAKAPRRARPVGRRARWPSNLALPVLNTLLVRALLPITAVGAALLAEERGWGLLHAVSPLPAWLAILVTVLALDLALYAQHVLFHAVPVLWRLHRMHHADLDVDVTTGTRFHPIEIVLSMILKFGGIAALGATTGGVLVFEILLNASSMFNHANLGLPERIDRRLRGLLVTPDMHRVHHSAEPAETNRNFGFTVPWWDRLFGTYQAQPHAGHDRMVLGLAQFRDPADLRLDRLLLQPFREPGPAPGSRLAAPGPGRRA